MGSAYRLRVLGMLAAAITMGCDAQVTPRFTGEALLTITGNIQIERPDAAEPLVPALAFWIPTAGEVRIQELAVQGEFPSDFRLDVYEPPPAEAYFAATRQPGEPRVAIAYITALAADHPTTIRAATQQKDTRFGCEPEKCDQPCDGDKGCLVSVAEFCSSDEVYCYSEATYCPTFNSSEDECTVVPGDGDSSLKQSPWRAFAGFSQNYLVVFLEQPAPNASATARMLGAQDDVPAGYGLYSVGALSPDQVADNYECAARAEMEAASDFNEEFGTALTTLEFDKVCTTQDFGAPPMAPAAPFCGGPIDELDRLDSVLDARERYIERAKVELGCALYDAAVERVVEPANESVTVTISPKLQPPFALP